MEMITALDVTLVFIGAERPVHRDHRVSGTRQAHFLIGKNAKSRAFDHAVLRVPTAGGGHEELTISRADVLDGSLAFAGLLYRGELYDLTRNPLVPVA